MERIFLDANVLIDGMVSRWSVSRAVLVLCANRVARLVLAEYVKIEVENALLTIAQSNRFKARLGMGSQWQRHVAQTPRRVIGSRGLDPVREPGH